VGADHVELDSRVLGSGPRAVLVHGGAGPQRTWELQPPLAERWQLVIPSRRGFGNSPPTDRQDFEHDAADLLPLLAPRAHLVGFSYGGLGALIAAARRPGLVTTLTIIEAPLFCVARGDPEVDRFEQLSNEFLAHGLDAPPGVLEEFLPAAALPAPGSGPLPPDVEAELRLARGGRQPGEARPDLDAIRQAKVPVLVVSGDHLPAIERVCDRLADALAGERAVIPGRGHAIPRADGFNERLEAFWTIAEAKRQARGATRIG
jgi:pimeloyl-ACP methyl ester carboxylesterase